MPKNVSALLNEINIPPRPTVLIKITEECKNESPNLDFIVKTICSDVGISGQILQVINSPYYGLRNKTSSIPQAINLLGLKKIQILIRSVAARSLDTQTSSLGRFWDTAETIAQICADLAANTPLVDPDDAYTLGLFHDCGIPVLMISLKNYNQFLYSANNDTRPLNTLEIEQYGISHAQAGAALAKKWFLPNDICKAILAHHREFECLIEQIGEDSSVLSMIALLKIAININYTYTSVYRNDPAVELEWQRDSKAVLNHIGFSETDYVDFEDKIVDKLEKNQLGLN